MKHPMIRAGMALTVTALAGFALSTAVQAATHTLKTVQDRGELVCGSDNSKPGYGYLNPSTGNMEGFDTDYCRAVAAAVLGDASKVKFITVTDKNRFNAIQNEEADVVFAHTTNTLTRSTAVGVDFLPVNFYDGAGALVKTEDGFEHIDDLNGGTICTTQGSTTEAQWANWMHNHQWDAQTQVLTFKDLNGSYAALQSGRCNAMSTDVTGLIGWKGNADDPDSLTILPERISKEPLGGFVSKDDRDWRIALTWITYALVQAEEYEITAANVDDMLKSDDINVQRFLGAKGSFGKDLGLPADFAYQMIKQVGNYGEIYARNLGPDTPYHISREGSLNALWTEGGLQYSPPFL